jgi:hypothetical protein
MTRIEQHAFAAVLIIASALLVVAAIAMVTR